LNQGGMYQVGVASDFRLRDRRSNGDGVDQVMVASGVRLRAGVKLGRCGILVEGRVSVWLWLA
jgi:hypothetical protein